MLSPLSQESQTIWDEPSTSLQSNVNVIEIEGSLPEQSVFVDGYMMKKNLAHKVDKQYDDLSIIEYEKKD